jgi:hypothetical protein
MNETLKTIPYTAISLSVIGRFIFMFLLCKNKSTNSLSLLFCGLNILQCSNARLSYDFPQFNRDFSIDIIIHLHNSQQNSGFA